MSSSYLENLFRKANLANCGWLVFMQRDGASLGVKNQHANCVRITAIESLGNWTKNY